MARNLRHFLPVGFVFIFIQLVWLGLTSVWHTPIFPSPLDVYAQLPAALEAGLVWHLGYSFGRILLGLILALIFGASLGYVMGRSSFWNKVLGPVLYLSYPIPKIALLPILLLLFGLGESSKILLLVLIIAPQVTLAVRDSVLQLPAKYYAIYHTLQATPWQTFSQVTFPAALPALFSSLRVSLGMAISVLFFAENYGTVYGMGYYILDAWTRLDYPTMYLGIIVLSVTGLLLFSLLDLVSRLLIRWQ